MNRLTQSKNATILPLLIALTFGCFGLSPQARAVCQEGCDLSNDNTFLGDDALTLNTTGSANTAIGSLALYSNTTGYHNTAIGVSALQNNTGLNNTANGFQALFSNGTGNDNTATGILALYSNTTGSENTASGVFALYNNTTGKYNTASGQDALYNNTTGFYNTATGVKALFSNGTGNNNTATGQNALLNNTTGSDNTATGQDALLANTGNGNTAEGVNALEFNTTGAYNIALGFEAGFKVTRGHYNIDIGNPGVAGDSHIIRIGARNRQTNAYIAGISGVTVAGGVGVIVDSGGHLGTVTSSARYKDAIEPMKDVSEKILSLQPVTFRYKKELDPEGIPQFGLVAEEVAKVDSDLVVPDEQGKPYTVRYEAVNAMLLNEFLKEHRKVEEQVAAIAVVKATIAKQNQTIANQQKEFRATVEQQEKVIEALTAALKAQAAQIQKVSDQLTAQAQAPRVVAND